jgi:hypothetical protein
MKSLTFNYLHRASLVTMLVLCVQLSFAQGSAAARKVLDKAAASLNGGGITASFSVSTFNGKDLQGGTSGSISIKGRKFHASTSQAIVWFDGKTEWTYMRKNDEVNVNNPTEAHLQSMNPYSFINMYKNGFDLSMSDTKMRGKSAYMVHMKAQSNTREIQEVLLTIDKTTYQPLCVRMRKGTKQWYVVSIKNISKKSLSDNMFRFNQKDFPKAEVIDLR